MYTQPQHSGYTSSTPPIDMSSHSTLEHNTYTLNPLCCRVCNHCIQHQARCQHRRTRHRRDSNVIHHIYHHRALRNNVITISTILLQSHTHALASPPTATNTHTTHTYMYWPSFAAGGDVVSALPPAVT
jgi:hypothetical protein